MGRIPSSVSLVAVGFGLAAICCIFGAQLSQSNESIQHLDILASPSQEQAAGTSKLQLWPLDRIDVALFLVVAVCLSLAGGAGIGGGAVLVPIFIMLRGWPTSTAVAMSNVTVLGGSFANFICNVTRRRANGARTIDWELILMMEPTTIAGALFGAILNKLLPTYVTTYLLTAMLTFMAIRLYRKGCQAYAKETQLLKAAKHAARAAAKAQAAPNLQQQALHDSPRITSSSSTTNPSTSLATIAAGNSSSRAGRGAVPAAAAASGRLGSPGGSPALSRSFNSSLSRSFSRSLSRLQSPMIVVADSAAAAAAAAAGASPRRQLRVATGLPGTPPAAWMGYGGQQQQQQAFLCLPRSETPPSQAAAAAAAAAVGSAGLSGRVSSWLPGMLHSDGASRLADLLEVSTLCQGDTLGDNVEGMVVLPLQTSYSSSASASSSEAGSAGDGPTAEEAAADLEAGEGYTAGSLSSRYADDANDLSRPLLAAAAPPAGDNTWRREVHGEVGSATPEVHIRQLASPDVLMQLGDDVAHGQQDVAVAGGSYSSRLAKGSGGTTDAAGSQLDHTEAKPPELLIEPCLPIPHVLVLLLLSAWVVGSDIAQGSVACGSWQYWAVTLSVLLPVAAILLTFRQVLLRKYRHDSLPPGAALPEGQLQWTPTTTLLYPLLCSSAGLVAGLFGIGGGVVKGPLMLELGVSPDVAAATSATMILFTAASACVVYSRFGQILADYGAVLVAFGFCTTLVSQLLTFVLIKLIGRRSVIVFMMVTLMSSACAIMFVQSGFMTRELVLNPSELSHFGRLCPKDSQGLGHLLQQLLRQIQ